MLSSLALATVLVVAAAAAPPLSVTEYLSDPSEMSLWKNAQWFPVGSALIEPKSQGVFLTKKGDVGAQRGGVWNPIPFPYSGGFNVTLQSKISYSNNDFKKTNAKGMGLWLVERPQAGLGAIGDVYGSHDRFKGLGVVFDTIDDDNHRNNPAISAHYLDGTKPYPHHNDGLGTQLAGCVADYRRMDNPVTTQVVYDGAHLSVYVNLEKKGLRKCLMVPLTMDLGRDLYLGVTAETVDNGLPPETHEIKSIYVNGVVGAYRSPTRSQQQYQAPPTTTSQQQYQAPPTTTSQQQYQAPPTTTSQQQYQAPPTTTSQQQYQAPPATYQAPATTPTTTAYQQEMDVTLHDKIDALMKAQSSSALGSGQAGEALKEVQTNLLQKLQQSTNHIVQQMRRVDQSLASHVASSSARMDAVQKLMDSTKGSIDAGRVDAERRANAADQIVEKMQKEVQEVVDVVGRLQRSVQQQISREIGKGTARLSKAAAQDGGSAANIWLWIVMFQVVFVAFLLYRHTTNKKLDKLL